MGRFDDRATTPARGPGDIFKWKVLGAFKGDKAKTAKGFVTPRATPDRLLVEGIAPQLTWIGHASFLLTLGGKRVLIDPVLAARMGPVKRLSAPGIAIEELPPIDVVLVTHDHRDHLDTWTLDRLPKTARFVVPLGNARFVGDSRTVDELDWWQSISIDDLTITLVPARHWSMRFPWDRNDALWGGFVVRGPEGAAYHSGDTALFDGFKEIGERCGPIDWAMLPIGAYDPRWFMKPQHMCPEEAVEAFDALGAKTMVAMHWGTFKLTDEPIDEPPGRARAAFAETIKDDRELWIPAVGETRKLH